MHVSLNGHDTYYDVAGSGTPVLVMHGGGLDSESLRPWLEPLTSQVQLIYYDQHGLGRSERPDDYSAVSNDAWADQAEALRAFLGHEKIVVFGHSYGGYIALEYALKYPDRVSGIVLLSTAAVLDYAAQVWAEASARSDGEQIKAVMALFHHPDAVAAAGAVEAPVTDDDLARLWQAVLPVYTSSLTAGDAGRLLEPIVFSAKGHNHQVDVLLPAYDVSARLAEITVPALVMTGAKDFITTPAAARRIKDGLKDCELFIFGRSGHFPYVEERDLFLQVLRNWLTARGYAGRGREVSPLANSGPAPMPVHDNAAFREYPAVGTSPERITITAAHDQRMRGRIRFAAPLIGQERAAAAGRVRPDRILEIRDEVLHAVVLLGHGAHLPGDIGTSPQAPVGQARVQLTGFLETLGEAHPITLVKRGRVGNT